MLLKNDRLLKAIRREPVDQTPIWLMRQAGRYLPEYRALREKAGSFLKLCKTPQWAAEITLQPLRRFPLDAAILFSDILVIPEAMGLDLTFMEGIGPQLSSPIRTQKDLKTLHPLSTNGLSFVYETIDVVKGALLNEVPLIGFCGSPFTLAAYMVEGRGKTGFPTLKQMIKADPQLLHQLLEMLASAVALHLQAQIDAGVDVVMIFDTWGGMLSNHEFPDFSLSYTKNVITQLKANFNYTMTMKNIPVIVFTRGGSQWLDAMADSGCDVIGLDWEMTLHEARQKVGHRVALQGNLNPAILTQPIDQIQDAVRTVLASYGAGSGHVFNLGHGVTPDVPPENVAALIDCVHEESKAYHHEFSSISQGKARKSGANL